MLRLCGGVDFVLSSGPPAALPAPAWSVEPSPAAGCVTDFLPPSTGERTKQRCGRGGGTRRGGGGLRRRRWLTVGAEVFVGAVRAVLLPVAGVGDVDAAAVVTLELIAGAAA